MEKLINIEAEQIILGALIINNDFYDSIDFLKTDFFYEITHQKIFEYLNNLLKVGKKADSITLKLFFDNEEIIKKIGGSKYLSVILGIGAGIVDIIDYAKLLQDLFKKRKLLEICQNFNTKIQKQFNKIKSLDLIEDFKSELDKIEDIAGFNHNLKNIQYPIFERLKEIKKSIQNNEFYNKDIVKTGFFDFDKKFNGLTKGELTIIAGCSSMGKTTLALQMALNFIKQKLNTLFFSLEMNSKSISNKILANQNKINSKRINVNNIYNQEIDNVIENSNLFNKSSLFVDDTYAINCNHITKLIKRFEREKGKVDVIIVDYLQIMTCEKEEKNRVREIGKITNGLKEIAKKFNCVVICLSQLSRSVEMRDDKRPILRDLRDSGEIEQIADMVMFVYRHYYYEKRKLSKFDKNKPEEKETYNKIKNKLDTIKNELDILVRKNRNGGCGDIKLHFDARFSKIINPDEVWREYYSKKNEN